MRARRPSIAIAFVLMRRAENVCGFILIVGFSVADDQWHFRTPGGSCTEGHMVKGFVAEVRFAFWAVSSKAVFMLVDVTGLKGLADTGQGVALAALLTVLPLFRAAVPCSPSSASVLRSSLVSPPVSWLADVMATRTPRRATAGLRGRPRPGGRGVVAARPLRCGRRGRLSRLVGSAAAALPGSMYAVVYVRCDLLTQSPGKTLGPHRRRGASTGLAAAARRARRARIWLRGGADAVCGRSDSWPDRRKRGLRRKGSLAVERWASLRRCGGLRGRSSPF